MVERVVLAVVLGSVAVVVAAAVRRRSGHGVPTQTGWSVPDQLDRHDFDRPEAPWLVAVFSSTSCLSCRGTWAKARHLQANEVAVQEVEALANKSLHERYRIDAVPLVVIADQQGEVRASFLGEPTATDLWAALAELREPGSTPAACDHGVTRP